MSKKSKIRLAIGTPSSGLCRIEYTESLLEFQKQLLKEKRFIVDDVCLLFYCSSVIPENRHRIVDMAREWKATHLMFVDDDMRFFPQAGLALIHTLLRNNLEIIGANCVKRQYPLEFMASGFDDKELVSFGKTGLEQAKYTGNSFILMDMKVYDKVSLPYYAFPWNENTKKFGTEDTFFMLKAFNEANIPTIVDHDVSMLIQHIGAHVFDPLKPRALVVDEEVKNLLAPMKDK